MTRKLYLLVIVFILIASCNKDDISPRHDDPCRAAHGHYPLDSDILNCRYLTGTYWVFIDSVNNAVDSVYISSYSQGDTYDPCNAFQYHSFYAVSYPFMDTVKYHLEINVFFKGSFDLHHGTVIYSSPNPVQYNFFGVPISARFDSLYIYNQYYYNVAKTNIYNEPAEGFRSIYYLNSDYGFLRTDVLDSNNVILSQKMLMRKHIVR